MPHVEGVEVANQLPDSGRGAVDRDFTRHGQGAGRVAAASHQQSSGNGEFEGIHLGSFSVSRR